MTEFKPETHQYFVDGKEIPSVTQICRALFCKERHYDPFYAERGTALHKAAELFDKGILNESTVDPEIKGFLDAYKKFIHEVKPKWEQIEVPLYTNYAAGTPDRIGEMLGKRVIVDIKTGQPEKWHHDQLAAYADIGDEYSSYRYALYLKKDGAYKLKNLEDVDPQLFHCYVATFNRMKELGVL